jgi:transcriptional regulator with XRE-family HTH domain
VSETLGVRIRRLREARGWSQSALARELECAPAVIWFWESGRKYPSVTNFAALAQAFGVSLDVLWYGWERWNREAGA